MKIHQCRLIYPYFDNPEMLKLQVENWNRYQGELREAIRIIVIDDHSSKPALPILEKCKAPVHCYRVVQRIPWNMHQCRNIGAKVACKKEENMWMFMSDIDIMLTPEVAYDMLTEQLDERFHYTFDRVFAPDYTVHKPHVNTFLVKHAAFWQVNGYDLDLTPAGGGGYGGDNQFRRQLAAICPEVYKSMIELIGYGRKHREGAPVIPDADTTSLDRAEWHAKYVKALERKKRLGDMRSVNPIRVNYTRVL